jgi:hypothetical protein
MRRVKYVEIWGSAQSNNITFIGECAKYSIYFEDKAESIFNNLKTKKANL